MLLFVNIVYIDLVGLLKKMNCFHERNNPFDMFAIQVCHLETNKRVGHLPMEISRISKFLMDRGAIFQARLTSTHYRRSPLVRGGLEIPCEITIRMPSNSCTKELLEKYDTLLNDLYVEPLFRKRFLDASSIFKKIWKMMSRSPTIR